MSWQAANMGEFNCSSIAVTVFDSRAGRELRILDDAMTVEGNVFNFLAPNGRVGFMLEWLPKKRKLIGGMFIIDSETGEERKYAGDKELSLPDPARYGFFIVQKAMEVERYGRMTWTSASVADDSRIWLTDAELDEIDKELYGESSVVLQRERENERLEHERKRMDSIAYEFTGDEFMDLISSLPPDQQESIIEKANLLKKTSDT